MRTIALATYNPVLATYSILSQGAVLLALGEAEVEALLAPYGGTKGKTAKETLCACLKVLALQDRPTDPNPARALLCQKILAYNAIH